MKPNKSLKGYFKYLWTNNKVGICAMVWLSVMALLTLQVWWMSLAFGVLAIIVFIDSIRRYKEE